GLVASGQDVKSLVRARHAGRPLPDDTPLTRGWRAEHVLPDLLAVLDGRRSVRVADLGAAAPLGDGEQGAASFSREPPAGGWAEGGGGPPRGGRGIAGRARSI